MSRKGNYKPPYSINEGFNLNTRFLKCHLEKSIGWIRIFGYGIKYKSLKEHGLMFSERYGHTKYISIGRYIISILK